MRSLNPSLCVLSLSVLLSNGCFAQAQADNVVQAKPAEAKASWPAMMLLAGEPGKPNVVPMGITAKRAVELAKTFYPHNDKLALVLLKNVCSELGVKPAKVQPFYLSKHPVTNEQYLRFVQATGARFPFHWWKFGQPKSFDEYRAKVRKAFPKDRGNAAMFYWEFNWKTEKLPYAIPPGTEKHPVVFVSWHDAMRYAAWAGMRLPTEQEWTLAAKGTTEREFVFGPKWDRSVLKALSMENLRDIKLKPVGALGPKAQGPFGHQDMVGQVWEWVIPLGYEPQTDRDLYESEFRKLKTDKKYGDRVESRAFKPGAAIAKGGSFFTFSNQDFIQARIGCRAPLAPANTMEALGFRVAKSKRAAYDMSLARLRIDYPTFMPGNIDAYLPRQVGIERYDLENGGGIIKNYHAVSMVPVTFASLKPGQDARKLKSDLMERPALTAVMITTEEILAPALKPGVYGVYYRPAGVPSELITALKQGHRELVAAAKARARAAKTKKPAKKDAKKKTEKKTEKQAKDDEGKQSKWEAIVTRFGYSMKEIEENDASELAKYVYVQHTGIEQKAGKEKVDTRFKVSTLKPQILFRNKDGQWVAAIDSTVKISRPTSKYNASTVVVTGGNDIEFGYGVMADQKEFEKTKGGKEFPFTFKLQLKEAWKN